MSRNPLSIGDALSFPLEYLDMSDSDGLVGRIKDKRLEGNRWFKGNYLIEAVLCYDFCINLTVRWLNEDSFPNTVSKKDLNRDLVLAYSNRAEAKLRLGEFDNALSDSDKALKIDPQHFNSLCRKGRAAHSLNRHHEACGAFEAAYEQSPEEKWIVPLLRANTVGLEKSYRLPDFFLKKTPGEVPSCADFVGPVQIRRVYDGRWQWGLFATRSVEAGELVLVSNPLAVVKATSTPKVLEDQLIRDLVHQTRTSKRKMAQLCSLLGSRNPEMENPPMELFRSRWEWVPENWDKFGADMYTSLIGDNGAYDEEKLTQAVITLDIVRVFGIFLIGEPSPGINAIDGLGLWVLPSFASHSCAPNVYRCFVRDALLLRASVNIEKGEEFTVSYLDEEQLFMNAGARQMLIKNRWSFKCNCQRCLLEVSFQPKLSSVTLNLSTFVKEVELMIERSQCNLGSTQQDWIRAVFINKYLQHVQMLEDKKISKRLFGKGKVASPGMVRKIHRHSLRLPLLKLVVKSITSVYRTSKAIKLAAILLREVQDECGKKSEAYKETEKIVLDISKVRFGQQPDQVLLELTRDSLSSYQNQSYQWSYAL